MSLEIQASATHQTVTGQPAEVATVESEASATGATSLASTLEPPEPVVTSDPAKPPESTTTVATVDIAPEALRQITALSANNRELKRQLAEATAKVTAAVPAADIDAKLKQLAALENETPRAYLKRTNKTLEDIAADVLADDSNVSDPRVDALTPVVDELKKTLAELQAKSTTDTTAQVAAAQAKQKQDASEYVKLTLASNPERWGLIQSNVDIGNAVIEAALIVAKRDFTDKTTGLVKQLTREQADSIIADCLDEAEIYEQAKKLQEGKKNAVAPGESLVKRRGLDVQDSESYQQRKGDDGKGANGARPPKVTIDGNRGAIRTGSVKRGPTDVRTARARMLKIAGAGGDDNE